MTHHSSEVDVETSETTTPIYEGVVNEMEFDPSKNMNESNTDTLEEWFPHERPLTATGVEPEEETDEDAEEEDAEEYDENEDDDDDDETEEEE